MARKPKPPPDEAIQLRGIRGAGLLRDGGFDSREIRFFHAKGGAFAPAYHFTGCGNRKTGDNF
jgi:hypothetical protein